MRDPDWSDVALAVLVSLGICWAIGAIISVNTDKQHRATIERLEKEWLLEKRLEDLEKTSHRHIQIPHSGGFQ